MKKSILVILGFVFSQITIAQNKFEAIIKDSTTNELLIGSRVFVKGANNGSISDAFGRIEINNVPNGKHIIVFSFMGYQTKEIVFDFSLNIQFPLVIFLNNEEHKIEEIIITSSTRSSRSIGNLPTRIETITGSELEEKSVMQPGNIKMLLTESTGIQTQQTSQVSGSASIRIQGLDGKYTQLLQDGFPLYSGFASGLSILQIPPLNLKRVEVIKGSSSTLYGGGAIAGLNNLITKEPAEKREISTLVNVNQTSALDISTFYSEKYKKTGMTVYTSGNFQKVYDNNNDGFSDIPEFSRFTFNPKFFYYPKEKTNISVGLNAGFEKRIGGDLQAVNDVSDPVHVYFERNNSNRYSSQTKYEKTFSNKKVLTIKNSIGYFNRKIERQSYSFEGQQIATYSEINVLIPNERSEWNIGLNYNTDNFNQLNQLTSKLDYYNGVLGAFTQNNFNISKKLIVESGLRLDYSNRQKMFALPRLSVLYKITPKLTSRIGGGMGYKLPTVFSEDSEGKAFQNIISLDYSKINPEKSYGLNADVNYKITLFDDVFISINQLFFYTAIQNPLLLNQINNSINFEFSNANGYIETKGFESNLKLRYDDFSCYIGYTYIDATRKIDGLNFVNPLTSKSRLNANVMYEVDEKLRIAYEVFYVGQQYLNTGDKTKDYWVMGISSEYKFKHFSLFVNFENFIDVRQSRWDTMYTGSTQNPQFKDVYTPTDGIIINGGFKLKL